MESTLPRRRKSGRKVGVLEAYSNVREKSCPDGPRRDGLSVNGPITLNPYLGGDLRALS